MRPPSRTGRLVAVTIFSLAAVGCTSARVGYRGRETAPIAKPDQIYYTDAMPDDHEAIGTLDMQCRTERRGGGAAASSYSGGSSGPSLRVNSGHAGVNAVFAGAALLFYLLALAAGPGRSESRAPAMDICGDWQVERAARERASRAGGDLITGISCNVYESGNGATSQCTAEVGRRLEGQSATDFPPGEVRARFLAAPDKPQTDTMPLGRVQIVAEAPRSAMLLGAVVGGCLSGCTRETVEPKMRESAARAGAPVLSDLVCAPEMGAFICRSKAWLTIERFEPTAPPKR